MSKLRLYQSIPLGIGSIIGSGILFLPSFTYKTSGSDVLLSWLLILILCIPGIFFFNELIQKSKTKDSTLSGMVALGLGQEVGQAINLILLGTVILGMPSSTVIAGRYCAHVSGINELKVIVPALLITFAVLVNYFGVKISSIISLVMASLIICISLYLISSTFQPIDRYNVLRPEYNLDNIYSGAVLSFWAFAGFENLTFLYYRFANPRRDLIVTIIVSVFICGLIYIGLVANYSAIVPYYQVKKSVGLLQMADYIGGRNLPVVIAMFSVVAVGINLVSWTSGVTQLVIKSSSQGMLPSSLSKSEKKSLIFLGLMFYLMLAIILLFPYLFEKILLIVSSNFLVIYLLMILSYFFAAQNKVSKIFAFLICTSILVTLSSSSYLLIYPFGIFLISLVKYKKVLFT